MHLGRDNFFFTGHEHEHVRERALGARHGQPQEDAGADQHAKATDEQEVLHLFAPHGREGEVVGHRARQGGEGEETGGEGEENGQRGRWREGEEHKMSGA